MVFGFIDEIEFPTKTSVRLHAQAEKWSKGFTNLENISSDNR